MSMKRSPAWYAEYQARRIKQIGKITSGGVEGHAGRVSWPGDAGSVMVPGSGSTPGASPTAGVESGPLANIEFIGDSAIRKDAPASRSGRLAGDALSASPPSKFRNVKTNGYASKREADRAFQLKLMQEAGQIQDLREQVRYELIPPQEGERPCHYVADFVYQDFCGREVVEDTKGIKTADYIIKRKLMLFRHGIRVQEV